jgi:hypothetical protein
MRESPVPRPPKAYCYVLTERTLGWAHPSHRQGKHRQVFYLQADHIAPDRTSRLVHEGYC